MPPKRSAQQTPSPAKKRRSQAKPEGKLDGRGSLHAFFKSPSSVKPKTSLVKESSHASSSKVTLEILDDDEIVARKLALEEGISLDKVFAAEQEWKKTAKPVQIIDVDALDDDESSETRLNGAFKTEDSSHPSSATNDNPAGVIDTALAPLENRAPESSSPKKRVFFTRIQTASIEEPIYPALDMDPISFSVTECPWNGPAPYSFLAHTLQAVSSTRSRISILSILTNALRLIIQHDSPSVLPALYLLSNSLTPPYVPVELGLGPSIIFNAIQQVSGLSVAALRRLYTKTGDLGDVAFEARSNLRTLIPHAALTVSSVYKSLLKICYSKGEGATKQKKSIAEKLLLATKGEEARYLVRTLTQHIRVGAVRTSILTALARSLVLTRPFSHQSFISGSPYFAPHELLSRIKAGRGKGKKKEEDPASLAVQAKFLEAEKILKQVYVQHPNYDHIAEAILNVGLEGLADNVKLSVGIPLHHTLGSPTRSLDEVYGRLGDLPFTAEFKYDGQRAQIHARRSEYKFFIRIFSRHLEDMTDKYPDVTFLVQEIFDIHTDLDSFILDTEIVAINPIDGGLRTFQELSNRPRKDVKLDEVTINVCVFAFDLMYHNDASLLEQPFRIRRKKLRTHFPSHIPSEATAARLAHVESCESSDGKEAIEEFWQRAIEGRSEGLMIKLLDSGEVNEDAEGSKGKQRRKPLPATYEPGKWRFQSDPLAALSHLLMNTDKRTSAWLKLKKDYVLGLGDSLDLVPIGAWHGNGRKAAWWSPILLALWDEESGQFVAVCKCMSGFTDEFYKALNERYIENSEVCSRTPQWNMNPGGYGPEVYFKPQEVWEIRGADITLSPVSVASIGLVSDDRGLSLRFPRFMHIREDKKVTDASTAEFLASMWRSQESRGKNSKGIDDGDLVDVSPEASEVEKDEYDE